MKTIQIKQYSQNTKNVVFSKYFGTFLMLLSSIFLSCLISLADINMGIEHIKAVFGAETEVEISKIEALHRGFERTKNGKLTKKTIYTPFVKYLFEGKNYETAVDNYRTDSMQVGDKIVIYINPDNPEKIYAKNGLRFGLLAITLFAVLPCIFFYIGFRFFKFALQTQADININDIRFKTRGTKIVFMITGGFFVLFVYIFSFDNISNIGKIAGVRTFGTKTEAEISKIETLFKGNGESAKHPKNALFVRYQFKGKWYEEPISYYSNTMYIGNKITIYVDSKEPSKICAKGELIANVFPIAMLFVAYYVGFAVLKAAWRTKTDEDY
jgi:hypothetical protein